VYFWLALVVAHFVPAFIYGLFVGTSKKKRVHNEQQNFGFPPLSSREVITKQPIKISFGIQKSLPGKNNFIQFILKVYMKIISFFNFFYLLSFTIPSHVW
jgi:hypothetical protein